MKDKIQVSSMELRGWGKPILFALVYACLSLRCNHDAQSRLTKFASFDGLIHEAIV